MWTSLPIDEKKEYKKMILAFASLTEVFAQKSDADETTEKPNPIINSKYQETIFQKVFSASAEDIGNTSYDAAIKKENQDGTVSKYLIGIKTFGINSGHQKIAQFKAFHNTWSELFNTMFNNSCNEDGTKRSKDEIDKLNNQLYKDLAVEIANLRNTRIKSSKENLKGFTVTEEENVESIYHVLMPSAKGQVPQIFVGETSYNEIDVDNIEILGCTSVKTPANFDFTDKKHVYRFTVADTQLLMNFDNHNIIKETWDVKYAEDAYEIFSNIANLVYGNEDAPQKDINDKQKEPALDKVTESYTWKIDVEPYSGFNGFYGVGSKMQTKNNYREKRIQKLRDIYQGEIEHTKLNEIISGLTVFLLEKASKNAEKYQKELLRKDLHEKLKAIDNIEFQKDVLKMLYRPITEVYIPIPNAKEFHRSHPNFFAPNAGLLREGTHKLALDPEQRKFNLVFEPSNTKIEAFITQDDGKGIESTINQAILGQWLLRGVFQLKEYEPLTMNALERVHINGIRMYKKLGSSDVFIKFVYIEDDEQ